MRNRRMDAEEAIRILAMREGLAIEEVREQMELAMAEGLGSEDPRIRARWEEIPRKGGTPTPEELIGYLAAHMGAESSS